MTVGEARWGHPRPANRVERLRKAAKLDRIAKMRALYDVLVFRDGTMIHKTEGDA